MSSWRKDPPTYREWQDAKNHGVWWVKFLLCKEEVTTDSEGRNVRFPEEWYTDIVAITVSFERGRLLDPNAATLHARGHIIGSIDLNNPEHVDGVYWQPAAAPLDDTDGKPNV